MKTPSVSLKENVEREVKEAARRRRMLQLEEQKRHSWAGEEVGVASGRRCSSETDMSAAASHRDDGGLPAELLSPNCRTRRSRNSPFSSEFTAADRELSTFLGMARPDPTDATPGFLSASPQRRRPGLSGRVTTRSSPQNTPPQAVQTSSSSPPKTQNANRTTATYLSDAATQDQAFNPTNTVQNQLYLPVTSGSNHPSDHNNNNADEGLPENLSGSKGRTDHADREWMEGKRVACTTPGSMFVVLEKHTLVPELKGFDDVAAVTGRNAIPRRGSPRDDAAAADLAEEEERADVRAQNTKESERTPSSLSHSDEDAGPEDEVIVWCVTGVCEAAGELTHADNAHKHTHAHTKQDRRRSDNRAGNQQASSASTNRTPSAHQPANEKPASVPISSQPVAVSRCDDPSHPASSPAWRPAEPPSANDAPALTSEDAAETANQTEEADDGSRNKTASCLTTNENTGAVSSTNEKEESSTKTSNHSSKTRQAGTKPAADANKRRPVRTLTGTEHQDMRRVVPIYRPSRGASFLGRRPEKPPGLPRSSSTAAAAAAVCNPSLNSASLRRVERPSTAPSSRRSSFQRTPDAKDSTDQRVSAQDQKASARDQNQQDLQRKPSIRRPSVQPRPPPEEKTCRSTLRLLSQDGGTSPSSLRGFARSTASSFFRQTRAPHPPPLSPRPGSDSSSKSSPPRVVTSSPLTRSSSLRERRAAAASRPPDLNLSSSSSLLGGSRGVGASPRRVPPVAPPGGRCRDDRSSRPSWR
ncbi:serine/arginine repetitive matrix protein 1-like [Etheostoma spectabile]|uniref:serine/arginine repetitive matrix protein 1-like n=1 Tax=Etheostoma spectabile TaxID=54343 RepID=UPI0013AFC02F|nr:serine/arginine repetitive matrix protein 1-like [Etheostoma spectabile]